MKTKAFNYNPLVSSVLYFAHQNQDMASRIESGELVLISSLA
jgi:hypothetical protein